MKIHKNSLMDHGIIKTLFSVQQKLVRQLLYERALRKATVSEHEQKVIKCEERKRKKGLKD